MRALSNLSPHAGNRWFRPAVIFAVCCLAGLGGGGSAKGEIIYVSPDGSDSNKGTIASPLATLDRARMAARERLSAGETDVQVVLRGGVYRLDETVIFRREDGVEPDTEGSVIYRAHEGETPVLSGSWPLPGPWEPLDESDKHFARYPQASRAHVRVAEIPEPWPRFDVLFWGEDRILPPARSRAYRQSNRPNPELEYRFRRAIDETHLYLPDGLLNQIAGFEGAMMRVVPRYPWVVNLLPMTEVDRKYGLVRTKVPATYPLTQPAFGHFPNGCLWIENVPEALDAPGEWVADREARRLYFWPPDDEEPGRTLLAPKLIELIRIEGEVDESDLKDKPVRGVRFEGLTFTQTNCLTWDANKTGWGLQHDWEMFDKATAMVRLRGAEECVIENCRFVQSGAAGVRMDLHAQRNEVRRCEFARLGGVGVLLAGYGMGFKDVNKENVIADNVMTGLGRIWWHSPAIFAWQSGHNRIVHNRISDLPYTAIVVSGRTQLDSALLKESSRTVRWDEFGPATEGIPRTWENREPFMHGRHNEVAWNDISDCMKILGDGNAIYVSGTGKGNRLHHNFIHDIDSANINAAIRCDDDQQEVTIEHNVIARTTGEGFIWKGRNVIRNNVVYDLRSRTSEGVECQHRRGFMVLSGAPVTGSVVERNVFYSTEPGQPILYEHPDPWKKGAQNMPPVKLSDAASADRNLYFNEADPNWAAEYLETQRTRGIEEHSRKSDPGFKDPATNDFTFKPGSPAVEMGIEPVDISAAGPRRE